MRTLKNARPWITSSLWKVNNLRIPSPCPLPAPSHACFGINLLGEGGSFAGGGGRPPPPANIFPLTSVDQSGLIWNQPLGRGIKGVGIAIMSWARYKLSDSKTDNQGILIALFRAEHNWLFVYSLFSGCLCLVSRWPIGLSTSNFVALASWIQAFLFCYFRTLSLCSYTQKAWGRKCVIKLITD